MARLEDEKFRNVIEHTPLVSIDLIVENASGDFLLGERINRPAQGFWFVPGGRVYKDESLSVAFQRIVKDELNRTCELPMASFLGVYEHFYDDNFFDSTFSTHYVVLGYHLKLSDELHFPIQQHSQFKFLSRADILNSNQVHENTKLYFKQEF